VTVDEPGRRVDSPPAVQERTGVSADPAPRPAVPAPTYRYDVDGLRGLAIALVVVYHVWFGRVSGGVDIFLTLSGFFFIGSLLRAAERPAGIRPVDTVRRIGKRLLPALVLVLGAVMALTVWLMPPMTWYASAKEVGSSLMFWQNWRLAVTGSDYLAADAAVSPLQHLWSISIQGQFYLAMILIVLVFSLVLRRFDLPVRLPLAVLLTAMAIASMTYAIVSEQEQTWLYYDGAARAWELLAGGILACVAPWLKVPRGIRVALAVVALAVVFGAGAVLEGREQFPGPWALVPVGAALALIVAGARGAEAAEDNPVSNWLASPRLIWLGTVAYALYLWHWPLLIAYLNLSWVDDVGFVDGAVIIALSLVLAEMSTRWVENPVRRSSGPVAVRRTLVGATAVVAAGVLASSYWWIGYIDREVARLAGDRVIDTEVYPGAQARLLGAEPAVANRFPNPLIAEQDQPSPNPDGCVSMWNDDAITCEYGDLDSDRVIALIGGSHSEHWLPALQQIGLDRGFKVRTLLKAGCPPVLPPTPEEAGERCEPWTYNVLDELAADPPDAVFATVTRPDEDSGGDRVPDDYQAFWAALDEMGIPMVGIRDTPWIRADGERRNVPHCLSGGGDEIDCGAPRAEMLSPENPAEAVADQYPLLSLIDLSDMFCRDDWCRVIEGNVVIYRDSNHVTVTYMQSVTPTLEAELGPALGWW